jgi:hypothetical protein
MACACKGRSKSKFLWTSGDGATKVTYDTEIEAKAKVLRKGGSYEPVGV